MGTSTSKSMKKKKISNKQQKRKQNILAKFDKLNTLKNSGGNFR